MWLKSGPGDNRCGGNGCRGSGVMRVSGRMRSESD